MTKKLVVPHFKTYEEEANWYDAHHKKIEDEFSRRTREGPIVYGPSPHFSHETEALMNTLRRRGMPCVLVTGRSEEDWYRTEAKSRPKLDRSGKRFVICIKNKGNEASLRIHEIYERLPDTDAEGEGMIRVIDESGEDYLFPRRSFLPIKLSRKMQTAVFAAARPEPGSRPKRPSRKGVVNRKRGSEHRASKDHTRERSVLSNPRGKLTQDDRVFLSVAKRLIDEHAELFKMLSHYKRPKRG